MSSSPVLPVLALVWLPLFDALDLLPLPEPVEPLLDAEVLGEPLELVEPVLLESVVLPDVPLKPPPDAPPPAEPPPMPLGVPPVEAELVPKAGWVDPLLEPEPALLLPLPLTLLLAPTLLCTSVGDPPPVPAPIPAVLLGVLLSVSSRLSWLVEPWLL